MDNSSRDKFYFDQQTGSGGYYVGQQRQRGHGIGAIFSGLMRYAVPLLKRAGKAGLKSAAKAAGNTLLSNFAAGETAPRARQKRIQRKNGYKMQRKRRQFIRRRRGPKPRVSRYNNGRSKFIL